MSCETFRWAARRKRAGERGVPACARASGAPGAETSRTGTGDRAWTARSATVCTG